MRRVAIPAFNIEYLVVVGTSLEPTDEELESLRGILVYLVPLSLIVAGIGGWFLAGRSLSPVVAMADRARQIGIENLSERLPVANPKDELGRLAGDLQRAAVAARGVADPAAAVHGRRVARAAHAADDGADGRERGAAAADAQRRRLSRDAAIIEQETIRLSRIVDDMFTLARADAGSYPVRTRRRYISTRWWTKSCARCARRRVDAARSRYLGEHASGRRSQVMKT